MDLDRALLITTRTGKVTYGFKESLEILRSGKAKLVILTQNLPREREEKIRHYAKISGIPILQYNGSSLDLGVVCEKPFPISVMVVRDPGDSEILKMVKNR